MYTDYFKLNEPPFSIAPDPRYLYMSPRHQEALAHLLYGVRNGGGFVALTGEVGTGKTTLCYSLLEQLPDDVDIALLLNPRLNSVELLANLCDELSINYPENTQSLKALTDALNQHLLATHAQGRRTVVMIDEAQNLSFEVLEQLRLLTNLETTTTKLLQIILVGQPELNELLGKDELRQLTQRITARYHLLPLSKNESADYIRHRLKISGGSEHIFSHAAIKAIHRAAKGIPRLINTICDRALLGAFTRSESKISQATAKYAAKEVLQTQTNKQLWPIVGYSAAALLGLIGIIAYFSNPQTTVSPPMVATNAVPQVTVTTSPLATKQPTPLPLPKPKPVNTVKTPELILQEPTFKALIESSEWTLEAALNQLYSLWKIYTPYEHSTLQRLAQRSQWQQMLHYNRPLVLELELANKEKRYLTLVGLEQNQPVVQLGKKRQTLKLADVLPYWQGYYALLWKPPAPDVTLLKAGDRNPAVVWLRERMLAAGHPSQPTENDDFFDYQLRLQIVEYQHQHNLTDDGLVGARTMIELNNTSKTPDIPKLTTDSD